MEEPVKITKGTEIQLEKSEFQNDVVNEDPNIKPPYQDWYKTVPIEKSNIENYDLEQAYNNLPLAEMQMFVSNKEAHLPDTYKKPTHPTFSNESIYHSDETPGGVWSEYEKDKWEFTPSETNIKTLGGPDKYSEWFKTAEPDVKLNLEIPEKVEDVKPVEEVKVEFEKYVAPMGESFNYAYRKARNMFIDGKGEKTFVWNKKEYGVMSADEAIAQGKQQWSYPDKPGYVGKPKEEKKKVDFVEPKLDVQEPVKPKQAQQPITSPEEREFNEVELGAIEGLKSNLESKRDRDVVDNVVNRYRAGKYNKYQAQKELSYLYNKEKLSKEFVQAYPSDKEGAYDDYKDSLSELNKNRAITLQQDTIRKGVEQVKQKGGNDLDYFKEVVKYSPKVDPLYPDKKDSILENPQSLNINNSIERIKQSVQSKDKVSVASELITMNQFDKKKSDDVANYLIDNGYMTADEIHDGIKENIMGHVPEEDKPFYVEALNQYKNYYITTRSLSLGLEIAKSVVSGNAPKITPILRQLFPTQYMGKMVGDVAAKILPKVIDPVANMGSKVAGQVTKKTPSLFRGFMKVLGKLAGPLGVAIDVATPTELGTGDTNPYMFDEGNIKKAMEFKKRDNLPQPKIASLIEKSSSRLLDRSEAAGSERSALSSLKKEYPILDPTMKIEHGAIGTSNSANVQFVNTLNNVSSLDVVKALALKLYDSYSEEDKEGTLPKIALYIGNMPKEEKEMISYFKGLVNDYALKEGWIDNKDEPALGVKKRKMIDTQINSDKKKAFTIESKRKEIFENSELETISNKVKGDDLSGRYIADISNGYIVEYQPRNEKKANRKDVEGLMVSDYLYDFDFTDNYKHANAEIFYRKLKERYNSGDEKQKFVQVRETLDNGQTKVSVKKLKDLDENELDNVYRQGYSKLSDFQITADKKSIYLKTYPNNFKNRGIPFRDDNDKDHSLRLPGAIGKHSKYVPFDELNGFGAYEGGTVTIISDDGNYVYKTSGSIKDIFDIAFQIQEITGGQEVHFLQSDAGSMNKKKIAKDKKIKKEDLVIARNQEPWAGASEIFKEAL